MRLNGWPFGQRSVKLTVTIALVTALVLVQPFQMWAQVPTMQSNGITVQNNAVSSLPPITQCTLSAQPLNAIDMNTVSFNTKVKSVHVEKEFFNCITIPSQQKVIVMVSIYNELFEDVRNNTLTKINTVETCIKEFNGTVIGCNSVLAPAILPHITTCTTQPLAFPVRMNTVVAIGPQTSPNVAETIEAEKEVFSCNPNPASGQPTTIEDVVIFTKMLEDMNTGKKLSTKFIVVTCDKNILTANVACN